MEAELPRALELAKDRVNCTEVKVLSSTRTTHTTLVLCQHVLRVLKVSLDAESPTSVCVMKALHGSIPIPTVVHAEYLQQSNTKPCRWYMVLMEYVNNAVLLSEFAGEPTDQFYKEMKQIVSVIREHPASRGGRVPWEVRDSYFLECSGSSKPHEYSCVRDFMAPRLGCGNAEISDIDGAPIVLCHCDLVPRNIFISYDGNHVISIIDWEMTSYCPDFYEYYKYLHEFKEVGGPPTLFTSKWLDIFNVPNVERAAECENAIHELHTRKYRGCSTDTSSSNIENITPEPSGGTQQC